MAISKIWAIKGSAYSLDTSLKYIKDKEKMKQESKTAERELEDSLSYIGKGAKTEEGELVAGFHVDVNNAVEEFIKVKEKNLAKVGKTLNDDQGNFAYHLVISFSPDDDINAEGALEFGLDFMEKFGKYQAVIASHTDRDHPHIHIIFNSHSFDPEAEFGRYTRMKYNDDNASKERIRDLVDELAIERGLSIVDRNIEIDLEKEWLIDGEPVSKTEYFIHGLKQEIDDLKVVSYNWEDFKNQAKARKILVNERGKTISYKNLNEEEMRRSVRQERLGKGYLKEDIEDYIFNKGLYQTKENEEKKIFDEQIEVAEIGEKMAEDEVLVLKDIIEEAKKDSKNWKEFKEKMEKQGVKVDSIGYSIIYKDKEFGRAIRQEQLGRGYMKKDIVSDIKSLEKEKTKDKKEVLKSRFIDPETGKIKKMYLDYGKDDGLLSALINMAKEILGLRDRKLEGEESSLRKSYSQMISENEKKIKDLTEAEEIIDSYEISDKQDLKEMLEELQGLKKKTNISLWKYKQINHYLKEISSLDTVEDLKKYSSEDFQKLKNLTKDESVFEELIEKIEFMMTKDHDLKIEHLDSDFHEVFSFLDQSIELLAENSININIVEGNLKFVEKQIFRTESLAFLYEDPSLYIRDHQEKELIQEDIVIDEKWDFVNKLEHYFNYDENFKNFMKENNLKKKDLNQEIIDEYEKEKEKAYAEAENRNEKIEVVKDVVDSFSELVERNMRTKQEIERRLETKELEVDRNRETEIEL